MKESFKHIADQLRCPSSSAGLEMGERMNQSNGRLISQTIELLNVEEGDSILEIGHGNGSHVADLFEKTSKITYKGLDISPLMNGEAQKRNQELIRQNKVDFQLYDGEQIPMEIGLFTKIFSVNTLYFIQQAEDFLAALSKLSADSCQLIISIVDKSFMEKRPFQEHGFRLYGEQEIRELVAKSSFKIKEIIKGMDTVASNLGEKLDRPYLIVNLYKHN